MPLSAGFHRNVARLTLLAQAVWLLPQQALAAPLSIPDTPLFMLTSAGVSPIVMLDASRDHQLFYKAYNDYTDLDPEKNDGVETTYKTTFQYYGYFDPQKCYDYKPDLGRFEPSGGSSAGSHYCDGNWSGNFLNWISMARVDVMRKVLFGGARSTDTATETVLERANLPADAHSWAKYYDGNDIARLTPFTSQNFDTPRAISFTAGSDNKDSTAFSVPLGTGAGFVGDQIVITKTSTDKLYGVVTAVSNGIFTLDFRDKVTLLKGTYSAQNLSRSGISFCNTTATKTGRSDSTTAPPVIRAAKGNYALWSANEKRQCQWADDYSNTQSGFTGGIRSNGNRYGAGTNTVLSEIGASAENPRKADVGLKQSGMTDPDFNARVKACVGTSTDSSLIGSENCKLYDNAYKPVGLLQKYGEGQVPRIFFGLTTGSFVKNVSGGVVRKNADVSLSGNTSSDKDEINPKTGVFKGIDGIIQSLSKLRVYGYRYDYGEYISDDSCNYQQIGIVSNGSGANAQGSPANEGNCSSWGNPMSEIYIESLRYLAGKDRTSAFDFNWSGSKDAAAGLTKPVAWVNPLNSSNYCAPLNVLMFNASVSSYDNDQAASAFSGFDTLSTWTDKVGNGEGITGNSAFVGSNGSSNDGTCSAKTIGSLSSVSGICPEAPSLQGTYSMAGAAYFAHTKPIRSSLGPAGDTTPYTVNTYGVSLATSVPRINVRVGDKTVVIQPAYRLDFDGTGKKIGTGTIVDFKIVKQDATSGKFYVNWEDSNQGGDYDQDVLGLISYQVSGSNITITTQIISASTNHPQGMGFIVSGTTKDGPHFYSGIYKFSYTDPTKITVTPSYEINSSGGCQECVDEWFREARSATFEVANSGAAISLQDPLYYAAKWGGFKDLNGTGKPDTQATWDSKKVDGTLGSDGQPDNYFYVTNPGALEQALDSAFTAIANAAAASAVASSTTSLTTDTAIYQAIFDPRDWTSDLVAYSLNPLTHTFTRLWSAQPGLNAPDSDARVIFTARDDTRAGVPFRWANLSATQQTSIRGSDTLEVAKSRLDYLRGNAANEGYGPTQFRVRTSTKLGDIVDSGPIYVGPPIGQYSASNRFKAAYTKSSYTTWRTSLNARPPMVYVGANDGMLHGFDAKTGAEKLAYIPSQVYPNLQGLSSQAYSQNHRYFVNGSPEVADAEFTTGWKSVLVGGLRKGGKGIYALDVTRPSDFTESNAASLALWEFTSADDSDMGYVYGTPLIAKMANGKWAAIVGNGYNSTDEKAAIFILFLEKTASGWTATDYKKIVAESGGSNGMAGVAAFDSDADGAPNALYAGDLKGNLWKFNVSDPNPANWGVALAGGPLAVACADTMDPCPTDKRRPITATPLTVSHPRDPHKPLVYFGSGKYLEGIDVGTTQSQSMYGVWDNNEATKRADYLVQTISSTGTKGERTVTAHTVDWDSKTGWVEDLPTSGERIIAPASTLGGVVFYNTFIPSVAPCEFGGAGYLMAVGYDNGGLLTWGDKEKQLGVFVDRDAIVAGIPVTSSAGSKTMAPGAGAQYGVAVSNTLKGDMEVEKIRTPPPKGTRISWRELLVQ